MLGGCCGLCFVVYVGWLLWHGFCGVCWVVVVAWILWCMLDVCCGLHIVVDLDGCCGLDFMVDIGWLMKPAFRWTLATLDMLNTQHNRYLSTYNLYTPHKFKEIIRRVLSAISRQELKTVFNNLLLRCQK
jgi:hypothetical protein